MNRTQLIDKVSEISCMDVQSVRSVLEAAERVMKDCLVRREDIRFEGFGVLTTRRRAAYIYGKGKPTERIVPASDFPFIRPSKLIVRQMNQ